MPAPVTLHICFRDQGIRWPLRDDYDVQVWTAGHALVATLSGRLIRQLVELHLAGAVIGLEMQSRVRKPLAILPPRELREQRRHQRRSRKKEGR